MKYFKLYILLSLIFCISASGQVSKTKILLPEQWYYQDASDYTLSTVSGDSTMTYTITLNKPEPAFYNIRIDLDSISGTPNYTIDLKGKVFAGDSWTDLEDDITWTGSSSDTVISFIQNTTSEFMRILQIQVNGLAGTGSANVDFVGLKSFRGVSLGANVFLPDTIWLIAGEEYTLYNDCVGLEEFGKIGYSYNWNSSIGSETSKGYLLNPSLADIGFETISVTTSVNSDTSILAIIPSSNGTDTTRILGLGNSLMAQGAGYMFDTIRTSLNATFPLFVGTNGVAPVNNQAVSGKTFTWYLNNESPFWIGGDVNYNAFRVDSLGLNSPVDLSLIQLGINDFFSSSRDTTYINTTVLNSAKSLITHLDDDTTTNIILAMPPKGENSGLGFLDDYGASYDPDYFIYKMQHFWRKLEEQAGYGVYKTSTSVCPSGLFIDRDLGYPHLSGVHSNAVHPNDTGYYQIGQAMAACVEGVLFNKYPNMVTNPYLDTWDGLAFPNDRPTGWTVSGNDANNYVEQDTDGNLHFYQTDQLLSISTTTGIQIGRNYKMQVAITEHSGGAIAIRSGGVNHIIAFAPGVYTAEFTAAGTDFQIRRQANNCEATISYISLVEIP